jgi:hypothetical protein
LPIRLYIHQQRLTGSAGAYGTERLSRGESSELFFVLPAGGELSDLMIELSMAAAAGPVDAVVELNDRPAGVVLVEGPTRRC